MKKVVFELVFWFGLIVTSFCAGYGKEKMKQDLGL